MWFMREAGVPAPRVSLVTMTVNGSDYGPYQLIEPVDKEFLQDHFANPEGNLYDDEGELTTNETTSTRARLELLYDKIETEHGKLDQSHTTFFAGLGGLADVDAFMRFMAAEIALATTDNFTDGAGNTYLYDQSPGPGLLPIPWDHDELFDITVADPTEALGTCISSAGFADEPQPFCELFWSDAGMRAALADELRRLRDGPMQQLPAELKRYCDEARPYVVADPFAGDEIATRFEADCAQIGDFIDTRIDFLENAAELK
jgi:spore coat protein CotH